MRTYRVDTGDGNELTVGLQEHEARQAAQRIADRLGETVYLSEEVEGSEDVAVEPEVAK